MIAAGPRSLDIPFLDGNMFRQVTISWTSDIVINFVNFLYGMEWKKNFTRSLIVGMDRSYSIPCSLDITRGISLVVNHRTEDVRVTLERPGTP